MVELSYEDAMATAELLHQASLATTEAVADARRDADLQALQVGHEES